MHGTNMKNIKINLYVQLIPILFDKTCDHLQEYKIESLDTLNF